MRLAQSTFGGFAASPPSPLRGQAGRPSWWRLWRHRCGRLTAAGVTRRVLRRGLLRRCGGRQQAPSVLATFGGVLSPAFRLRRRRSRSGGINVAALWPYWPLCGLIGHKLATLPTLKCWYAAAFV